MPHMQIARRIGKHGQRVKFLFIAVFRANRVIIYFVGLIPSPNFLPFGFDLLRVISDVHHVSINMRIYIE